MHVCYCVSCVFYILSLCVYVDCVVCVFVFRTFVDVCVCACVCVCVFPVCECVRVFFLFFPFVLLFVCVCLCSCFFVRMCSLVVCSFVHLCLCLLFVLFVLFVLIALLCVFVLSFPVVCVCARVNCAFVSCFEYFVVDVCVFLCFCVCVSWQFGTVNSAKVPCRGDAGVAFVAGTLTHGESFVAWRVDQRSIHGDRKKGAQIELG